MPRGTQANIASDLIKFNILQPRREAATGFHKPVTQGPPQRS